MPNWGSKFPFVIYRDHASVDHTAIVTKVLNPTTGEVNLHIFSTDSGEAPKAVGYDPPNENVIHALSGTNKEGVPEDTTPNDPSTRQWRAMP